MILEVVCVCVYSATRFKNDIYIYIYTRRTYANKHDDYPKTLYYPLILVPSRNGNVDRQKSPLIYTNDSSGGWPASQEIVSQSLAAPGNLQLVITHVWCYLQLAAPLQQKPHLKRLRRNDLVLPR